ncbi:MAG: protoheme IX farnesyltransferase [Fimbriimonadales bacterium]|nr:MAG: protoheme IX farnesyltransferase [Fimbriimonadales bacterium]
MRTALRSVSAPLSGSIMQKLRAYWMLSKPRVTILVWLTMVAGLILGGWGQSLGGGLIAATLIGSWLVIASANALNQAYEWRQDALMQRTMHRPIPSGQVSPLEGWLLGILWGVLGVLTLGLWVNLSVALLGMVSILLYAFAYTPLKQRSHFSTAIGAIPGALPPVAGWVAAQGGFSLEAWLLFALQFVWQFPHFWAIAWLYRDEYAKAKFHMLPYPDASAEATARLVLWYTVAMIVISLMFAPFTIHRWLYLLGALTLGLWAFTAALRFLKTPRTPQGARGLLISSVLYLPLLLIWMILSLL